jgi:hypothetical protein
MTASACWCSMFEGAHGGGAVSCATPYNHTPNGANSHPPHNRPTAPNRNQPTASTSPPPVGLHHFVGLVDLVVELDDLLQRLEAPEERNEIETGCGETSVRQAAQAGAFARSHQTRPPADRRAAAGRRSNTRHAAFATRQKPRPRRNWQDASPFALVLLHRHDLLEPVEGLPRVVALQHAWWRGRMWAHGRACAGEWTCHLRLLAIKSGAAADEANGAVWCGRGLL